MASEATSTRLASGSEAAAFVRVEGLTLVRDELLIQAGVTFSVQSGEIFAIGGRSGCGKSTLMRAMIGLLPAAAGEVYYRGRAFLNSTGQERLAIQRLFGVLFQSGALWSSLTLAENIMLPMRVHLRLSRKEMCERAAAKLAMVGLAGLEDRLPAQLSGGMRKRAALARALALDPPLLFADEPHAGLDPVTARLLDDLLLELRASLGLTVVMITHELDSLFATADRLLFLDADTRRPSAIGPLKTLMQQTDNLALMQFLHRGRFSPN